MCPETSYFNRKRNFNRERRKNTMLHTHKYKSIPLNIKSSNIIKVPRCFCQSEQRNGLLSGNRILNRSTSILNLLLISKITRKFNLCEADISYRNQMTNKFFCSLHFFLRINLASEMSLFCHAWDAFAFGLFVLIAKSSPIPFGWFRRLNVVYAIVKIEHMTNAHTLTHSLALSTQNWLSTGKCVFVALKFSAINFVSEFALNSHIFAPYLAAEKLGPLRQLCWYFEIVIC